MTNLIEKVDLCINCLNAFECGYRANYLKPIIFCEEFSCNESEKLQSKKLTHHKPEILHTDVNRIVDTMLFLS